MAASTAADLRPMVVAQRRWKSSSGATSAVSHNSEIVRIPTTLTRVDAGARRDHDNVPVCRGRRELSDDKWPLELHHRVVRVLHEEQSRSDGGRRISLIRSGSTSIFSLWRALKNEYFQLMDGDRSMRLCVSSCPRAISSMPYHCQPPPQLRFSDSPLTLFPSPVSKDSAYKNATENPN